MQQRYFMKLSIIIPVFNVERTLQRCIESVQRQSFQNFEMILVDDGTKDRSGKIADEMAADDNRITVIHQSNQGLSEARNTGINKARGEYITFIDSDDFIGENTYEDLFNIIKEHPEYDILEYSVIERYGSNKQNHLSLKDTCYYDMKDYWLQARAYRHTYAWNKIYKRELFSNVRFPKGKTFEDVHTLPLLLDNAKIVATTSTGTYFYCYNQQGITKNAKGADLTNLLEAHSDYIRRTKNVDKDYYAHVLNIQIDVYEATHGLPTLPVLPYWGTLKLSFLHLIGLKRLCKLYQFIHKIARRSH